MLLLPPRGRIDNGDRRPNSCSFIAYRSLRRLRRRDQRRVGVEIGEQLLQRPDLGQIVDRDIGLEDYNLCLGPRLAIATAAAPEPTGHDSQLGRGSREGPYRIRSEPYAFTIASADASSTPLESADFVGE